jgi:DNA-binding response OmpR family regulator
MMALLKNIFNPRFNIFSASNGHEALEWLQMGNIPNVIISDLKMPKMNGIEFLKNLRESAFYQNIPLIMLSGEEKSSERINCLQMGANDFVLKPFNPEELIIRVKKLLKLA